MPVLRATRVVGTVPTSQLPAGHVMRTVGPGNAKAIRFDARQALRERRSTDDLEALLAERLAILRADPPRGYPT